MVDVTGVMIVIITVTCKSVVIRMGVTVTAVSGLSYSNGTNYHKTCIFRRRLWCFGVGGQLAG